MDNPELPTPFTLEPDGVSSLNELQQENRINKEQIQALKSSIDSKEHQIIDLLEQISCIRADLQSMRPSIARRRAESDFR